MGRICAAAALALSFGCASSAPPPPSTAQDFYERGLDVLKGRRVLFFIQSVDYRRAIQLLEEVVQNFPFSEYATLAELAIGDAYFGQLQFEQAEGVFQEFVELHPKHPKIPYALLRLGECNFAQMLAPDQDQAKTSAAVEQFNRLIERFPEDESAARARELRAQALDRLALHEVEIGDFYFGSEKYHAAAPRYRDALERSSEHPGAESTRAKLGVALNRMGLRDQAVAVLGQLDWEDPSLGDLVDETRDELDREFAALRPGSTAAASSDSEGGWRLWPFGSNSDEAVQVSEEEEVGAQSGDLDTAGASRGWRLWPPWPFGRSAKQPISDAAAPRDETDESAAERAGRGWRLWPFGSREQEAEQEPEGSEATRPEGTTAQESESPEASEESGGWRLWPFGGGDD